MCIKEVSSFVFMSEVYHCQKLPYKVIYRNNRNLCSISNLKAYHWNHWEKIKLGNFAGYYLMRFFLFQIILTEQLLLTSVLKQKFKANRESRQIPQMLFKAAKRIPTWSILKCGRDKTGGNIFLPEVVTSFQLEQTFKAKLKIPIWGKCSRNVKYFYNASEISQGFNHPRELLINRHFASLHFRVKCMLYFQLAQ